MASKTVDEILSEINKGAKDNEIKLDIQKGQLDLVSKLIGFLLAILGIILGGLTVFKAGTVPINSYVFILMCFAAYFIFFMVFYNSYSKSIVDNLSKSHIQMRMVMEAFATLEAVYADKFSKLEAQAKIAEKTAENIANSPLSNLISWEQSGKLELDSSRVFAISIDLSWASNLTKLKEIFDDLKNNLNDKYFYILTSNSEIAITNLNTMNNYLQAEDAAHPSKLLRQRFKIIQLKELKVNGCNVYEDGNFTLPIPNDIVLYKAKGRLTAVISTSTITRQRTEEDIMEKYDVKFTNINEVSRIEIWFKRTWKDITNESINNE